MQFLPNMPDYWGRVYHELGNTSRTVMDLQKQWHAAIHATSSPKTSPAGKPGKKVNFSESTKKAPQDFAKRDGPVRTMQVQDFLNKNSFNKDKSKSHARDNWMAVAINEARNSQKNGTDAPSPEGGGLTKTLFKSYSTT